MLLLHLLSVASLVASISGLATSTPLTYTPLPTLTARDQASTSTSSSTATFPTGIFTETDSIIIPGVTNSHVTIPGKTIQIALPTCHQTITPDSNGYVPPGTCGALWDYYPSFKAAVALACLFGVLVCIHIWQAVVYKKTYVWVLIMACIWETMAMIFRALSSKNQQSEGIFLFFQIFILLAPLWVNAFVYMTFSRMVYKFHPTGAIFGLPAPTIAAIFVFLDVVSFIVQLVGGSMAGPGAPITEQQHAIHIYMGGIGLQEFWIVVFVVLCISFQTHMNKLYNGMRLWQTSCGPLLCTLYLSLAMITVRIIYRLVEFSGGLGQDNALTSKEAYFYVLETLPMFIALLAYNIVHPGRVITGPGSDMPGFFALLKLKFGKRPHKKLPDVDGVDEQELSNRWNGQT